MTEFKPTVKLTGWTKADGHTLWMCEDGVPVFREGHLPDLGTNRAVHLTGVNPQSDGRFTKYLGYEYLAAISDDQTQYVIELKRGTRLRIRKSPTLIDGWAMDIRRYGDWLPYLKDGTNEMIVQDALYNIRVHGPVGED